MLERSRGPTLSLKVMLKLLVRSPVSMNSNRIRKGYVKATKGYVIYSPQPEVNKSHIHEVPKNNGLLFHIGEVSEWWRKTMVNMFFFVVLKSRQASTQIVLSIIRTPITSLIVINVPTRTLLAGQTRGCFVPCLVNLNIKRNLTTMFVKKYLPYSFGKINTSLFEV